MSLLEIIGNKNLKLEFSGVDCLQHCRNKEHFKNYKKQVSYNYNSNGFRDSEWPIDLTNKIWCIGDSFTAGVGQPQNEIWPALLEQKLKERCLNISEDGCSNDLIARRAKYIIKNYQPKLIVIMWSYFWRRFIDGKNVQFNIERKELPKDDLENFLENFFTVNEHHNNIINFVIPDCFVASASSRNILLTTKKKKNLSKLLSSVTNRELPDIIEVEQVDYARDGYHYDLLTCQQIIEKILTKYQK